MHKKKHELPPSEPAFPTTKLEKYVCDMCDFVADKKLKLHKHKRAAHDAREFLCDKCNYSAAKMCSLKMHVQIVHDGIRYVVKN